MIIGYLISEKDNEELLNKYKWPTEFVAVPRKGERIKSICGKSYARVDSIIHTMVIEKVDEMPIDRTITCHPAIEIKVWDIR